jgi:hypothetical protein
MAHRGTPLLDAEVLPSDIYYTWNTNTDGTVVCNPISIEECVNCNLRDEYNAPIPRTLIHDTRLTRKRGIRGNLLPLPLIPETEDERDIRRNNNQTMYYHWFWKVYQHLFCINVGTYGTPELAFRCLQFAHLPSLDTQLLLMEHLLEYVWLACDVHASSVPFPENMRRCHRSICLYETQTRDLVRYFIKNGIDNMENSTRDPRWVFVHRMSHMMFSDEQIHLSAMLRWVQQMCIRIMGAIHVNTRIHMPGELLITNVMWRSAPVGSWNVCEQHSVIRLQHLSRDREERKIEIYKFDD